MLTVASGLAPLAFEAVKWGKRAYTGYKALKAVADKAQSFRRAPAIISQTCALCAALLEPMAVAEALATRHVSLRIVGPALTLAQVTVAQFNALVVEPEDDDWQTWLQTGVAGVSNESRLQGLQGALTRAMTAMQLALISVSVSLEPRVAVAPFRFLRGAFQNAHDRLVQMEMGRERRLRLCGGELWRRGIRLGSGGEPIDAMQRLFDVRVSLQRGEPSAADDDDDFDDDDDGGGGDEKDEGDDDEKKSDTETGDAEARGGGGGGHGCDELTLRFDPLDSGGGGGGGGGAETVVVLAMERGLRFRRVWARQLAAEIAPPHGDDFADLVGAESLCYEFTAAATSSSSSSGATPSSRTPSKLVLAFQFGGCGSAEQVDRGLNPSPSPSPTLKPQPPTPAPNPSSRPQSQPRRCLLDSSRRCSTWHVRRASRQPGSSAPCRSPRCTTATTPRGSPSSWRICSARSARSRARRSGVVRRRARATRTHW